MTHKKPDSGSSERPRGAPVHARPCPVHEGPDGNVTSRFIAYQSRPSSGEIARAR